MLCRPVLGVLFLCSLQLAAPAQKTGNGNSVQGSLDARSWTMVAQSITPMRGGLRQLTSYYDLRVSNDSAISNLPYFGRAYIAPMNPAEGGLNFSSLLSGYQIKTGKKGRRDISFSTKSSDDTQRMQLTVYNDGTASLQVISNNRDPVTFSGFIKASDKK